MTISLLGARRGSQTPRVANFPPYPLSAAPEVIDLAEHAGLVLDEWQQYVLTHGLGQRTDESWTAPKVSVWVPRQNGKGGIIEALELAWLFLFDEDVIIHSAHQHRTSATAYRRLEKLIRATPDLHRMVAAYRQANGEQEIRLQDGRVLQYNTRSRTALRGFSAKKLILDEAQELTEDQMAAIQPTVSAMPNPQMWFLGTPPGDPDAWCYGLRDEGEAGAPRLAHFDWGAGTLTDTTECRVLVDDPETAYATNPALGIRIAAETVSDERRPSGLGAGFARERLGMWAPRAVPGKVIDPAKWAGLALDDGRWQAGRDVALGVDISPLRDYAAISVYGRRADGLGQLQLIAYEGGTAWLADKIAAWCAARDPVAVGMGTGTYKGLQTELEQRGITVPEKPDEPKRGDIAVIGGPDMAAGCGHIIDDVRQEQIRYVPSPQLDAAVAGARARQTDAGGVAWVRKDTDSDISPLGAATVARRAYEVRAHLVADDYDVLDSVR